MKEIIKTTIRPVIQRFGFDIVRHQKKDLYPRDFSEQNIEICDIVKPYTKTSPERVNALIGAVQYVVKNKIDGAMVECGVWKGGSTMAMALTLKNLGDESRELYLYDTFSGMSAPTDVDISIDGAKADDTFSQTKISEDSSDWYSSSLGEVKENLFTTGYPKGKIHFIEGKVENTIPTEIPNKIALLRLDTDWYESTKHEMTHLFPLLKQNGVLVIDDYGYWEGARKAIDEYISDNSIRILLHRIDYTGRIAIKI